MAVRCNLLTDGANSAGEAAAPEETASPPEGTRAPHPGPAPRRHRRPRPGAGHPHFCFQRPHATPASHLLTTTGAPPPAPKALGNPPRCFPAGREGGSAFRLQGGRLWPPRAPNRHVQPRAARVEGARGRLGGAGPSAGGRLRGGPWARGGRHSRVSGRRRCRAGPGSSPPGACETGGTWPAPRPGAARSGGTWAAVRGAPSGQPPPGTARLSGRGVRGGQVWPPQQGSPPTL